MKRKIGISHDAFGKCLLAHWRGQEYYELVEREDGFINPSSYAGVYFAPFRQWPPYHRAGMRYARGRVLDVGCGAGRVALYLTQKGNQVTCIDNSPLAIRVCRIRGVKDARVMSIEEIGKFKAGSFDTIVMYGNNFGLFGNFKKARRLLKMMHRITSPHARIIAESNDPYKTDDPAHVRYQYQNRTQGRMAGQVRIRVRFREYIGPWFNYLLVSQAEMKAILKGTGWKVREFINSPKSTYIAVIEKI